MKAQELYDSLDKDFEIVKYKDEWGVGLECNEFINPDFKERYIGVMLNNSDEINKVYTSTFPDNIILDKLLNRNETDILLFSHHAMGYDPTFEGFPFYNIPVEYLKELKARRISFYVLHIPLDKNGIYSTSMSLARVLQLPVESEFCEYLGCKVGVICETDFTKITDFALHVKKIVGHDIKVRQYGGEVIEGGRVAIAAGGGCIDFVARELSELGLNTYLTGLTKPMPSFEPGMEFHRIAKESKINVVGATHYSTEKYACMAMEDYFAGLGIEAEFVEGTPCMEDL
ncbi:MAG: Nif3-like dinuclear metal center hexameric protein [Planctomycetes bacterium]|nr:Nif3-like dinuclear metal center hexameric protein [Planctomycetota bacterium]MBL7143353.1 Nif3-like dinuclear metal center hexameric protein [Phycisphaerae bacterium]